MLFASAYVLVAIVAAVWLSQGWRGEFVAHVVGDGASLVGALVAAGCTGWAARSTRGRARRGWLALTAGLLAWAVGAAIWSYYEVWRGPDVFPGPSIADVAFLLFPVGAVAALLWLPAGTTRQSVIRQVLDAIIVATSVIILAWVTLLERVFVGTRHSGLDAVVPLTYLMLSCVVIAVAILVFAAALPARRLSLGLLAGGLGLMAAVDLVVTYTLSSGGNEADHFTDLIRYLAFGLVAVAALTAIRAPTDQPSRTQVAPRVHLWLPYLPLVLAVSIWFCHVLPAIGLVLLILAVLLVIAVLVRQFVVLDQNQHLLSGVAQLAYRDQLTGLANRTLFLDRLERAVLRRRHEGGPLAVLCLDLDNFKTVNDDLGHPAGDELLIRVAGRLSACLRSSDSVARLGGDEFAVLVEGLRRGGAHRG